MSEDKNDKSTKEAVVENPEFPFKGSRYETVPRIDAIKLLAEMRGVSVDEMTEAAKMGMVMYQGARIKGPEDVGMPVDKYWQKLAGVENTPETPREQVRLKTKTRLALMSTRELAELSQDVLAGITHVDTTLLADEIRNRGFTWSGKYSDVKAIHTGDCCDGTMFSFASGVEVCVKPPTFTEIDELNGDIICINKAPKDKNLPSTLMVMGDGANATYFNRSLMPGWLWEFLRAEVKNDPATAETRKKLWEQMKKAVSKRPRKKKDGTSRSSLGQLKKPTKTKQKK